jgi:hypothetical protein
VRSVEHLSLQRQLFFPGEDIRHSNRYGGGMLFDKYDRQDESGVVEVSGIR